MPTTKRGPRAGNSTGRKRQRTAGGRSDTSTLPLPGCPAVEDDVKQSKVETWLTPYYEEWVTRFGSPPTAILKQMAQCLRPLEREHPPESVRRAFRAYLADVEARYVSLHKFAATFGAWINEASAPSSYRPTWVD